MDSRSHIRLLLLLLFSVLVSKSSSSLYGMDVTVHVQNDIDDHEVSLDMHCQSYDDDLGHHWLHQGEEWHWEFGEIPGSTKFWCDFRWYDNRDQHWYSGTFEVYRAYMIIERYRGYCDGDCRWSARRDGFYLYRRDKKEWQKRNDWHAE
ncbi:hypothetical protein MKX01_003963 [Papaver californicum]|nr:hypothetical protein MKX01_003963 [Papaver californicum]